MPESASRAAGSQDRVLSYLHRVLPNCELGSESLVSGYAPLIFAWKKHAMAAFAFAQDDIPASYKTLYEGFKEYYARNRVRLDAVDLAFVLCIDGDFPSYAQFCSAVETDVYFCRKFVVRLRTDLGRSFERLPFLPFASRSHGLLRPPAAQTFMRQCGVPATLARYLAVPHQRGSRNIVSDCIRNEANWEPVLSKEQIGDAERIGSEPGGQRVLLDSISVRNFRAYRRRQDLTLGRAITVLYGPNGFGKTSLFDAIDFAVTGGVGRLGLSVNGDRFAKAVTHLDSTSRAASVELGFRQNGLLRTLRRQVASRMRASLDRSPCDRKRALLEITGGPGRGRDRIEHLVSLFRATHLFSQEGQELAKGFGDDCTLPPQVVSRMLAFEDYGRARSKATEVCGIPATIGGPGGREGGCVAGRHRRGETRHPQRVRYR